MTVVSESVDLSAEGRDGIGHGDHPDGKRSYVSTEHLPLEHAKQIWAQNRPYRISLEVAHPPACSAALIEVGKAVRAGMTAFAVISGDAPGLARAVALAAFAPRGGSSRKEDQSYD